MTYNSDYLSAPIYFGSKGAAQMWVLDTVDLVATVIASGYISDAFMRGMQIGDQVTIRKFDSLTLRTNPSISLHQVTAVSESVGATLSAAYGDDSGLTVPVVSGTTTPTVNDDVGDGYALGSLWIETDVDEVYVTTDNSTAAAVWKPIVDHFMLTFQGLDIDSNNAVTNAIALPVPVPAKLVSAFTVVEGVTTTAAGTVTVTLSRNGTAITNGVITIPGGSADGTVNSCAPTALNTFSAGDVLNGVMTTTSTADDVVNFVAYFERLAS